MCALFTVCVRERCREYAVVGCVSQRYNSTRPPQLSLLLLLLRDAPAAEMFCSASDVPEWRTPVLKRVLSDQLGLPTRFSFSPSHIKPSALGLLICLTSLALHL
jgi:hypothetical protein